MTAAEALATARWKWGVQAVVSRTFDADPVYLVGPRVGKVIGVGSTWRLAFLQAGVRPEEFQLRYRRAA